MIEPMVLFSTTGTPLTVFSSGVIANYRRMLTGLRYNGSIPSRIAMVSALRGEGVTYSSLALGATLASDLAATVGVIELNWWNPGLLAQLGEATRPAKTRRNQPVPEVTAELPSSPGLSAVMSGTATVEEALITTNLPNLSLLPAGEMPVHQRASVARSPALTSTIEDLATRFDYLILDVPPLMVNSDGMALASLAEAACIVVRQGVTPINFVRQSLDEVTHLKVLGVVLNQSKINMPRWVYNLIPQE